MIGGGGGFISQMITTLKNNRKLLSKREPFEKIKPYQVKTPHHDLRFKHISKEELKAFHDMMAHEKKIDTAKRVFILLASVLITALLIFGAVELFL